MSSCSAWRWVTRAMGPPSATAALSALTLFSRPTWSGTIISGKMTVSRSATSGSSRVGAAVCGSSVWVDGRLAIGFSWFRCSCVAVVLRWWLGGPWRPRSGVGSRSWSASCAAGRLARRLGGPAVRSLVVETLEDPRPETLLELEEDPHAREVDAEVLGQVANPEDPPDVVLAVEPDVRRRPGRTDETLVLVDPQGSRMDADDARRHADDVDGTSRVPVRPAVRHSIRPRCRRSA